MSAGEGFVEPLNVELATDSIENETSVSPEVVESLRSMTDRVLEANGMSPEEIRALKDTEFKISNPDRLYDLRIWTIAAGHVGYNTSRSDEDNSRRWVLHIDRGTNFGMAYDFKGVVYEHGGYAPSPYRHNIDTGTITDLVHDFYDDNLLGTVTFEATVQEDDKSKLVRIGKLTPVHPLN